MLCKQQWVFGKEDVSYWHSILGFVKECIKLRFRCFILDGSDKKFTFTGSFYGYLYSTHHDQLDNVEELQPIFSGNFFLLGFRRHLHCCCSRLWLFEAIKRNQNTHSSNDFLNESFSDGH